MKESQNTEFKSSWRDEYLKHICAFANTRGGSIFIGIQDDGAIKGVKDAKKLLEDIPNKVIHYLGIIVDVHLHDENGKEYLEVLVPQSSIPISYKGVYYVKSGSTKQELKGGELQHFLLKKMGRTFDEISMDSASISDIDEKAVRKFLHKAISSNRLSPEVISDSLHDILSNLRLFTEDGKLKGAAVLLFGKEPLRFFSGVTFKIGRFGTSDHDLRFQDVIEGNIFEMSDKVIETLRAKYLVSPIRYEGLQRIEALEYPEEALREAILNAVIHKDYTGVFIQLSVYNDKLVLWNQGRLPEEISVEKLVQKHPSIPRNRLIADIFFKAGYIEAWGRGIRKIIDGFVNAGHPEPVFEELAGGIQVTLFKGVGKTVGETVGKTVGVLISLLKDYPEITREELAKKTGLSIRGVEYNLNKLKKNGLLKRIGPAKGGRWEVTG